MERVRRHKIWVVWLLLAVFTLPFAVKAIHSYYTAGPSGYGCSGKLHSHHDYSDCPVCQFTLSSFTEATVAGSGFRVILFDFEPVLSFQPDFCQQVHLSYGLRAPPRV